MQNNQIITIDGLCQELHIKKTKAYALVKNGVIPSTKFGKQILIQRTDLDNYIHTLFQSSPNN